jgi:glycosyltransferase involved in cell wall biosynthesis
MRLTLINQFYTPDISPTAHLCASLAEHRAELGDDVTVLTSRTGYLAAVSNEQETDKVKIRRLWSTRLGSRTAFGRLIDWLSFYIPAFWAAVTLPRQDVIVAMTTPPFIALAGWLHKRLHRTPRFILWNMDVYPEAVERTRLVKPGGLVSRVMRAANRVIFRQLDHLVCLDGAMAELLLSQYMPHDRAVPHTVIPNWEQARLLPAEDPPARPDDQFVVLYLGNAGYGHEFHTLIDAAQRLRDEPVTFLFVGGGAQRPWIARQCEQRKLANIVFQDYVPKSQTPATMAKADCALITLEDPMLGVMSPSKLHANLAMSLPVIYVGPRRSNVDEAIERFGCGVSLRPGDAEGLVFIVRELMKNRGKHAELRQRARKAFEEAYCDFRTLPQFDRVIDVA